MAGSNQLCGLLRDGHLLRGAATHATSKQIVGSYRKPHGLGSAMDADDEPLLSSSWYTIPVRRAQREIAYNLSLARRQQRITVELLADRAGISVPTLRRLLNEGMGSLENYLRVASILGLL